MTKAINWPKEFLDEVIHEDPGAVRSAFRIGRLYYDNHYWVDGEEVDIRVNHKIIRKALVVGDLKCCSIGELTDADYSLQKHTLQTAQSVIAHLFLTYDEPVSLETEITIVYYKNQPIDPEIMEIEDDPHME